MTDDDEQLDARMRDLFRRVDTSAGFEARVMQRVRTEAAAPASDLRAQFERRRELARRRLRRDAWSSAATAVGIGAAAGALLWQHATGIMEWARAGGADELAPWLLTGGFAAAAAAVAWPYLRRFAPR